MFYGEFVFDRRRVYAPRQVISKYVNFGVFTFSRSKPRTLFVTIVKRTTRFGGRLYRGAQRHHLVNDVSCLVLEKAHFYTFHRYEKKRSDAVITFESENSASVRDTIYNIWTLSEIFDNRWNS